MKLHPIIPLLCFAITIRAEVVIDAEEPETKITTAAYTAKLSAGGHLTSLKVGGEEWMSLHLWSKGAYFYEGNKVFSLTSRAHSGSTVTFDNQGAAPGSVACEFADGALKLTATNAQEKELSFLVVLDPAVKVGGGGRELKLTRGATAVKLAVSRDAVPMGWEGRSFLVVKVPAKGAAELNLTFPADSASATPATAPTTVPAKSGAKVAAETASPLSLTSPQDYQVFQRSTLREGAVLVKGEAPGEIDAVEVQFAGKSEFGALPAGWQKVSVEGRAYSTSITMPAGGWYRVTVRASKGGKTFAEQTLEHVGVGEVFIGAGQSNSTSCGDTPTKQTSGMVANFTGKTWRLADDPQLGASDKEKGGSFYPAFGDALYAKYRVPIGVSPTGCTGTSVKYWVPAFDLYKNLAKRIAALGGPTGFRAVLWHQGESDAHGMPADEYYKLLKSTIDRSRKDAGADIPWVVAVVSYPGMADSTGTRVAQKRLATEKIVFAGPDTDKLAGDMRDKTKVHFSAKGLKAHGELWAKSVELVIEGAAR